jgi:hypothetical protein
MDNICAGKCWHRALQEYGRLARTRHVLREYANKEDRRRVMR